MTDTPTGPSPEIAQVLDEIDALALAVDISDDHTISSRLRGVATRLRALLAAPESETPTPATCQRCGCAILSQFARFCGPCEVALRAAQARPVSQPPMLQDIQRICGLDVSHAMRVQQFIAGLASYPVSEPPAPAPTAEAPVERRAEAPCNPERVRKLATSFAQEWLRPDAPEQASEVLVRTLTTVMTAFYAAARSAAERDVLLAAPNIQKYGCHQCGVSFSHAPEIWNVSGIPAQTHFFCSATCRSNWLDGKSAAPSLASRAALPDSRPTAGEAPSERLRELAREAAATNHGERYRGRNGPEMLVEGHTADFATCPHPDCGLVRASTSSPERPTPITDETSDGYHTFNELYDYRKVYNALLFNEWASRGLYDVHKAWKHSDGEPCFGGGWFIVVAETPVGQISNHYKTEDWSLFRCVERERGNPYDGHTPQVALARLLKLAASPERPTAAQGETTEPEVAALLKRAGDWLGKEWDRSVETFNPSESHCEEAADIMRLLVFCVENEARAAQGGSVSPEVLEKLDALISRVQKDAQAELDEAARYGAHSLSLNAKKLDVAKSAARSEALHRTIAQVHHWYLCELKDIRALLVPAAGTPANGHPQEPK